MATRSKRFGEYSARWQREARRDGISPRRWDAWLKLSERTRRRTSQRDYAMGLSIRVLLRADLERAAIDNMMRSVFGAREATVRRNVRKMTLPQLGWTAKADERQIRRRAGRKVGPSEINPWWYR